MKKTFFWLIVLVVGTAFFFSIQNGVFAVDNTRLDEFAQNDSLFYDPCVEAEGEESRTSCYSLDELTWADLAPLTPNDRLKLMVEHYGEYAMQLQKYYGVPWEMPFAVMVYESQVGADQNSVSYLVQKAGYYNMMGLTYPVPGSFEDDKYMMKGVGDNGCFRNETYRECHVGYQSISKMLLGYVIYHGRSGFAADRSYDAGLKVLDPNNYNISEAIQRLMETYCAGGCYRDEIMGMIRPGGNDHGWSGLLDAVKEKGWKNSEELAKAWNIKPGGIATEKWGWGDIREKIWNEYGEDGLPDCQTNGGEAIAKKAIELAWPDDDTSHLKKEYPAFLEAAAAVDSTGWIEKNSCGSQDCGFFVSVVVRNSNVDPDFPKYTATIRNTTKTLLPYLQDSARWEEIENTGKFDNLKPGDIMINRDEQAGRGHIRIYVGELGGKYNIAEASRCDWTGMLVKRTSMTGSHGPYHVFRIKSQTEVKGKTTANENTIVAMAEDLAWDEGQRPSNILMANNVYNEAARKLGGKFITNPGECTATSPAGICPSCARFVSMVLLETNLDPDFVASSKDGNVYKPHMIGMNAGNLTHYLINSPKWMEVTDYNGKGYSKLQPGDILVSDPNYNPSHMAVKSSFTHTFIYLGNGRVAEADNSRAAPFEYKWDHGGSAPGNNDGFVAFRYVGGTDSVKKVELHTPTNPWLDNAGLEGFKVLKALNSELSGNEYIDDNAMKKDRTDTYTSFAADAGNGKGLPGFIVLHWTGSSYSEAKSGGDYYQYGYCGGTDYICPPHFTIDVVNKKIWQHFPLSSPSAAVAAGFDGTTWDRYAIQIEVVGIGDDSSGAEWNVYKFTDDQYDYLAKLLIAISNETGIPLVSDLEWDENAADLSTAELKKFIGVAGHEHIPQPGGKVDPGKMWKYIEPALKRLGYVYNGGLEEATNCDGTSSSKTSNGGGCYSLAENDGGCTDDGYTYYWQHSASQWGSTVITSCNSNDWNEGRLTYGCGYMATSMAVTALSGKMVTPKDIVKVAQGLSPSGFYVCGVGMDDSAPGAIINSGNFGVRAEQFNDYNVESVNKVLKDGGMLIVSVGTDSNGNGDTTFSSGGHFIVIRSLTANGKWRLLNSVDRPANVNNTEYEPEFMISQIRQHGSHTGWVVKK